MAKDSVTFDKSMIQELIKTVKSLHFDMVELKSGGNGPNKPTIQPEPLVKLIMQKFNCSENSKMTS